ncbi:unnamed protein product [Linum trigynum]|uniref:Uncharacterized protein n=1 Tax=Linum trigynum TaxID=586398 RepID=A0AAV2GII4_9ROSI
MNSLLFKETNFASWNATRFVGLNVTFEDGRTVRSRGRCSRVNSPKVSRFDIEAQQSQPLVRDEWAVGRRMAG